jgi:Na+/H+-dicarboxylate symporter
LQDPIGTTANVMGNGAFALILQRAAGVFAPKKATEESISKSTKAQSEFVG